MRLAMAKTSRHRIFVFFTCIELGAGTLESSKSPVAHAFSETRVADLRVAGILRILTSIERNADGNADGNHESLYEILTGWEPRKLLHATQSERWLGPRV